MHTSIEQQHLPLAGRRNAPAIVMAMVIAAAAVTARADVMTFQSIADTTLIGDVNANYTYGTGGLPVGYTNNAAGLTRSLIRFDLSELAGKDIVVNSVTLRLTVSLPTTTEGTAPRETRVYEISAANADWVEGTGAHVSNIGEATWNSKRHSQAAWAGSSGLSTPGVDYVDTLLASESYPSIPAVDTVVDFAFSGTDLTALINSWASSMPGLLLLDPLPHGGSTHQRIVYYSRNTAPESAFIPTLIVDYQVVPEPASAAFLGLGILLIARRAGRPSSERDRR